MIKLLLFFILQFGGEVRPKSKFIVALKAKLKHDVSEKEALI